MAKKVDSLDKILDNVCDEIDKIATTGITTSNLEVLDKLVDIKKDILELQERENMNVEMNNMPNGMSNTSYRNNNMSMRGSNYNRYNYNNGMSGHYPRQPYYVQADMWGGFPMGGYSRTGSQDMIEELKMMAEESSPEKRDMIHNFIDQLERM